MKFTHRMATFLLIIALVAGQTFAQQQSTESPSPKPLSLSELQARISTLLDQPKFAPARWGVLIKTTDGKVLFERDADKAFVPASNMKLYTTAAALDMFGPDFKVKTSVYATKPIGKHGHLRGDLILYGRGDPNLSPRFESDDPEKYEELKPADRIIAIEKLADQLKAAGIKIVTGNVIGDESYFAGDPFGPSWEWDDLQFSYGAEVSALTVNDNIVTFTFAHGRRVGDKPVITVQPATSYVKIVNNAKTSADDRVRIGVHRPLGSNTVEFFGSISISARSDTVNIAVHDPARFAATLLKEALERRGIKIRGKVQRLDALARVKQPFDESKLLEIASVQSQPLSEILKVVNKQSQNLHTEILLRQLGALVGENNGLDDYGRPIQTANLGNNARKLFLEKAGIDVRSLSLRDGSGLARQNLITPRSTTHLLEYMFTHPHFNTFRESLAIAGADGTLKRRMRDAPTANNVRGKTGSLSYINALSGYLTTKRGQTLIFSFVGNNYVAGGRDVTNVMDEICALLSDFDGDLP